MTLYIDYYWIQLKKLWKYLIDITTGKCSAWIQHMVGGNIFQQITDIHMRTMCAPLIPDIFLYSYEEDYSKSHPRLYNYIHTLISHWKFTITPGLECPLLQYCYWILERFRQYGIFVFNFITSNYKFVEQLLYKFI